MINEDNLEIVLNDNDVEKDVFRGGVGMSNTYPTTDNLSIYTYKVCIDYLKFKFVNFRSLEDEFVSGLFDILLIDKHQITSNSSHLYKFMYILDEDIAFFGGAETQKNSLDEYTYFFELKGHALRMFELRCEEHQIDYIKRYHELFSYLFKYVIDENVKVRFKRIDVAIDDFTNSIKKEEYDFRFKNGLYCTSLRSRAKFDANLYNEHNEVIGKGWSWYIGSRCSGNYLNVYDKVLERKNRADLDVIVPSWIRVEARFSNEKADNVAITLLNGIYKNEFDKTICSLIGSVLDIKEKNNYQRKDMYKASRWKKWDKLLNMTEPVNLKKISQGVLEELITDRKKENITLERTLGWLEKSCYKAISILYLLNPDNFNSYISNLMDKFLKHIDEIDLSKINYYRIEHNLPRITNKEAEIMLYEKISMLRKVSIEEIVLTAKKLIGDSINIKEENEHE